MSLTRSAIAQGFLWRGEPVRCPICGVLVQDSGEAGVLGLCGWNQGRVMPWLSCRSCVEEGSLRGLLHGHLMPVVEGRIRRDPATFAFPLSVPHVHAPAASVEPYTTAEAFDAGIRCRADARSRGADVAALPCTVCELELQRGEVGLIFGVVRQLHPAITIMGALACNSCLHPDAAADLIVREPVFESETGWTSRFNPGTVFPSKP